jgi:WXG100 family type VII secretion target
MNDCIKSEFLDKAISKREAILEKYNEINEELDSIVEELLKNWKGQGADAFRSDVDKVKKNMSGLYDVLKTICDSIEDCQYLIAKDDKALGDYNSEAGLKNE